MDNKDLFRREENGYNTADVEKYINTLKTEYRRVFEYAKRMRQITRSSRGSAAR